MKIGYLVPEFPGQTHIFFWREIIALKELGIETGIISTRPPKISLQPHSWTEDAIGRTTYLIPHLRRFLPAAVMPSLATLLNGGDIRSTSLGRLSSFKKLLPIVACALKLKSHCELNNICHVHIHSCANCAYIGRVARDLGGPSYSLTLHNPLQCYGPDQIFKWKKAAFGIAITKKIHEEVTTTLGDFCPKYLSVSPMGVSAAKFQRTINYKPWEYGPIKLFCCGRLNRVKGYQELLQSVRQLKDQGVEVKLRIAGEDDQGGTGYRNEMTKLISSLAIADSVELLGAVSEECVKRELEACHIFVLASHEEPLGVAYMEAMSMEVPVIGTDAGGVSELITNGFTGVLVKPKSAEEITKAVCRLRSDPEECIRLGEAARKAMLALGTQINSPKIIAESVERLYSDTSRSLTKNSY